jgi:thiol-disulfide isomerase/thioredoxin
MRFDKPALLRVTWNAGIKPVMMLFICCLLVACNEDLNPDSKDLRPSIEAGSEGNNVGQLAVDFSMETTLEEPINLLDELQIYDAVVLYFTMWCPLCDSHMTSLRQNVKSEFPNVRFLVVDYVTGSLAQSRSAQLANGYASETVLPDTSQILVKQFAGTMGSTIVIRADRSILMNEDYKESKLLGILAALN